MLTQGLLKLLVVLGLLKEFSATYLFLSVLNDTILILNDQGGHSDSFRIDLVSFRTFRGPLFLKQITYKELLNGSTVYTNSYNVLMVCLNLGSIQKNLELNTNYSLATYSILENQIFLPISELNRENRAKLENVQLE